jgi:hypothetical protein
MHWSFALLQPEHVGVILSHLIFLRAHTWQLKPILGISGLESCCAWTDEVWAGAGAIGTRREAAILASILGERLI